MSITGTDIRLRTAPSATRAFVLAAVVLTALAAGFVIGRETVQEIGAARTAAVEQAIATTWLDDTPSVRTEIMQKMNALGTATPWLDTSSTGRAVMHHMNELDPAAQPVPAAQAIPVRRSVNQLADPTGS